MDKKRIKNDIFLALGVLLAAGILYGTMQLFSGNGKWAVIEQDGREIARLPLETSHKYQIDSTWGSNEVCTAKGYVWMENADCPDALCIGQGKINSTDGRIVCLPHRLVIRIEGAAQGLDDMAS